jgi:hypothetical protein
MTIREGVFLGGEKRLHSVEVVFVRRICSLFFFLVSSCFSDTVNLSALPV